MNIKNISEKSKKNINCALEESRSRVSQEFLKKTIFVVSTPVEAVGLSILAKNNVIENCVIVDYKNYTDVYYRELILRILRDSKIKKILFLTLNFYLNTYKRGDIYRTFKEVNSNRRMIKKFNYDNFNGNLFKCDFNFVIQHFSPFLIHGKYDINKIYTMEHSVGDAVVRISEQDNHKKNSLIKLKPMFISSKNLKIIFKKLFYLIKRKLISMGLACVAPGRNSVSKCKQGFTWLKYLKGFIYLDFREYEGIIHSTYDNPNFHAKKKTFLLIDHQKMFLDIPAIYEDVSTIDYIQMYGEIVKKHIKKDEIIVCKFHPYINQKLGDLEAKNYLVALKEKFISIGYENVIFFQDLFDQKTSNMPAEIFMRPLKINKVVGVYSTTMWITQEWGDVTVISDCSYSHSLRELRKHEAEIFHESAIEMH